MPVQSLGETIQNEFHLSKLSQILQWITWATHNGNPIVKKYPFLNFYSSHSILPLPLLSDYFFCSLTVAIVVVLVQISLIIWKVINPYAYFDERNCLRVVSFYFKQKVYLINYSCFIITRRFWMDRRKYNLYIYTLLMFQAPLSKPDFGHTYPLVHTIEHDFAV